MDIQMAIIDGIEATKQIRSEEKWRAIHGCLHGPTNTNTDYRNNPVSFQCYHRRTYGLFDGA